MNLTIKNEAAHRRAQELAEVTGERLTAAVTGAVRVRVRRAQDVRLAERLLAMGRDCAAHLKEPFKSAASTTSSARRRLLWSG